MPNDDDPSLIKIHGLLERIDERTKHLDQVYAKKWVETWAKGISSLFGISIAAVVATLFKLKGGS